MTNEYPQFLRQAGGRRRYNAQRQLRAALLRRQMLLRWPLIDLVPTRGQISEAAAALGVSRTTIWRWCKQVRQAWYAELWSEPTSEAGAARQAALRWRLLRQSGAGEIL